MRLLLIPCTAMVLLASTSPQAENVKRTIAVEGHIEFEKRTTALSLEIPWQAYGLPFEEFAEARHDPVEATFAALMTGLRAADPDRVAPHLATSDPVAEVVAFWHRAFGGFENLDVVGRSRIGAVDVFFWRLSLKGRSIVRAFAFQQSEGRWQADMVSSSQPVLTLILHSLSRGEKGRDRPFQLDLPVAGSDATVALRFDGQSRAFNVFDDDLTSLDDPLHFYAETLRMLVTGEDDAVIARYTPKSAEKMRKQLSNDGGDAYRASRRQPRIVWFVMDADPFVLVFFTEGQNAADPEQTLRYDTLVRTDKGLRFTNFFYGSFLDHALEQVFPSTRAALEAELIRK